MTYEIGASFRNTFNLIYSSSMLNKIFSNPILISLFLSIIIILLIMLIYPCKLNTPARAIFKLFFYIFGI